MVSTIMNWLAQEAPKQKPKPKVRKKTVVFLYQKELNEAKKELKRVQLRLSEVTLVVNQLEKMKKEVTNG